VELLVSAHTPTLVAVVVVLAMVLATAGKATSTGPGASLLALPFQLAWAICALAGKLLLKTLGKLALLVARWLGFRPGHLPALAATGLLVVQAGPRIGFRLPLALALAGWLGWVRRPGRRGSAGSGSGFARRSARWLRRAERRYTEALGEATRTLRTQAGRDGKRKSEPAPERERSRSSRPRTSTAARQRARGGAGGRGRARRAAARATRRPARGPRPAAAKSKAPPARAPAQASYGTPPPLPFEPVWPRWLGGGRWRQGPGRPSDHTPTNPKPNPMPPQEGTPDDQQ
jgi:hypothetical protein